VMSESTAIDACACAVTAALESHVMSGGMPPA